MPIELELPTGEILEFPDGTTDAQMDVAVSEFLGGTPTRDGLTREQFSEQFRTQIPAEAMQPAQGFGPELRRSVAGATIGTLGGLTEAGVGIGQATRQALGVPRSPQLDTAAQQFEQAFEGAPTSMQVGRFAGRVAPFMPAFGATSVPVAGAISGGLEGFTRPDPTGEVEGIDRLQSAGIGGTVGAAAPVVMGQALRGAGAVSENVRRVFARRNTDVLDNVLEATAQGIDDITINQQLGDQLTRRGRDSVKEVGKLFDNAAKLGDQAFAKRPVLEGLTSSLDDLQRNTFDADGIKYIDNVKAALTDTDKLSINQLHILRRSATNDGGRLRAAVDVKNLLDNAMTEAVEQGQVTGNKQAVAAWGKAISKYRTHAERFKNPKLIADVLSDNITPEEMAQRMFGAGSITTARGAARQYDDVIRAAGKDAEPLLKQSIVANMFRFAQRNVDDPNEFWVQRAAREISNLERQNKSLWNKFSDGEKQALRQMARAMDESTQAGVINKFADGGLALASRMFRPFGFTTNLRLPSVLQPQQIGRLDELSQYFKVKPEVPESSLRKIGRSLDLKAKDKRVLGLVSERLRNQKGAIGRLTNDDLKLLDELEVPEGFGSGFSIPEQITAPTAEEFAKRINNVRPDAVKKAAQQGFDTKRVAFRGLNKDYDPERASRQAYQMFTSDAQQAGEYGLNLHGGNVVPAFLKKGKNLSIDGAGRNFNVLPTSGVPSNVKKFLPQQGNVPVTTDDLAFAAKKAGYDSVTVRNVFDNAFGERTGSPTTVDMIFDPKNIRSVNAKFDPKKRGSADLLAGAAGLGILGTTQGE